MKKKIIIIPLSIIFIAIVGVLLWLFVFGGMSSNNNSGAEIFVTSVSEITGIGSGISSQTRFSGVVEAQETKDITKDVDKKVAELLVGVGDEVVAGQELFRYDTDDINLKLQQTKLEVESIKNKITSLNRQIADLTAERNKAAEADKLGYTLQIQTIEIDIKTEEYNQQIKQADVAKIEKSLENTSVVSEIDGVVTQINSNNETDNNGQEKPYISIMSTGAYKIKSTVTELNINAISEGTAVLVRSRVNEEETWGGVVESVNRENPVQSNNNNYIGGTDSAQNTASKYNFYVALNDYENLILGQHVFVELDYGIDEPASGLALPSYYLVSENNKYYVWASKNEKIEKREVTVGEYNESMDTYEILSGLVAEDYIAFPDDTLSEGMKTTTQYVEPNPDQNNTGDDIILDDNTIGGDNLGVPEDLEGITGDDNGIVAEPENPLVEEDVPQEDGAVG